MNATTRRDTWLLILAWGVLSAALWINLDAHHLFVHTDEPRRALVALEMILSGDYLTPTLNGEPYLNKPPLYNWLIAASFQLIGRYDEWALRVPAVLSLYLLALVVALSVARHHGLFLGALTALALATSGRILFFDSFLGLIDIAFSALVVAGMSTIFHLGEAEHWRSLFVFSYLLCAIAFLMKGLPALAFQGLTLLAYLGWRRAWRRLFSLDHAWGLLAFLLPVGAYYLAYFHRNPGLEEAVFARLWSESAKRTGLEFGLGPVLVHLGTFPFEFLFHFLPWTLLALLLLAKGVRRALFDHPFHTFCGLAFLANVWLYWTSPQVYPRYLFAFAALMTALVIPAHALAEHHAPRWKQAIEALLGGLIALALIAALALPFTDRTGHYPHALLKSAFLALALTAILWAYWRGRLHRLVLLGLALAFIRLGFDWFNLPGRDGELTPLKHQALAVARLTQNQPLYIYDGTPVHDGTSFYISAERREILRRSDRAQPGTFYIVATPLLQRLPPYEEWMQFRTTHYSGWLHLVRIGENTLETIPETDGPQHKEERPS